MVFDFRLGSGRDGPKRGKQLENPESAGRAEPETHATAIGLKRASEDPNDPTALPALPSPLLALGEESIA